MSTTALARRSIVVVGASSGIGRGVAERSIRAGAKVVLAARRAAALWKLVAEVGGHAVPTDIRDDESCRRLAEEVAAVAAPVDLLLISAGTAALRCRARPSSRSDGCRPTGETLPEPPAIHGDIVVMCRTLDEEQRQITAGV